GKHLARHCVSHAFIGGAVQAVRAEVDRIAHGNAYGGTQSHGCVEQHAITAVDAVGDAGEDRAAHVTAETLPTVILGVRRIGHATIANGSTSRVEIGVVHGDVSGI